MSALGRSVCSDVSLASHNFRAMRGQGTQFKLVSRERPERDANQPD